MRLIGDILVSGRALTQEQLERALEHKSKAKGHLGTAILETTNVSEQLVLRALSLQHKVPPAGPAEIDDVRPDILRLIPVKLAARHQVIPFRRLGRVLSVAMVNPADLPATDEISFLTGLQIAPHVALELRIALALGKHYGLDVPPRFVALQEKLDKNKVGVAGRAYTATRPPTSAPPAAAPAPPTSSGSWSPSGPPPPPSFARSGRQEGPPPGGSGDPWGAVDVPAAADASIVTETFPKPPSPVLDDTDLRRLRTPSSYPPQAAAPSAPVIHEPSPLPRIPKVPEPTTPTVPVSRTPVPPSRFSANVSGSWMDQEDTPFPSSAPEVPAPVAAPPAPRPPSSPAVVAAVQALGPATPPPRPPSAPAMSAVAAPPAAAPPAAQRELDLASRLAGAESRDEIADAVLAGTAGLVTRAALFIAQPDGVLGWAARPEPSEELRGVSIPYSEPSLFASLRNTDGFYAGPLPDLAGNRRLMAALGSTGTPAVALVPVTLKGKSVLFLYAEAEPGGAPPPVPELKRLAAMTAIALEIVLLKNKLRNL